MPKIVKIEGVGNVAFPDTMDDAAISHAIETDILMRPGVAKNVPGTVANTAAARIAARSSVPRESTLEQIAAPIAHPLDTANGFLSSINPLPALTHPIDAFNTDMATRGAALDRLKAEGSKLITRDPMDPQSGKDLRDMFTYAVPFFGPAMAHAGEQMESLDPHERAKGFGGAIGLTSGPKIVKMATTDAAGTVSDVLAARRSTVPVQVDMPNPGPVRQTIGNLAGFVMPEKLHSALKPLWSGGGTRTVRVPVSDAPSPTPRVTSTGTDFPMHPSSVPELPADASASKAVPSLPLRHPDDWFRPVPEAEYGNAPVQPLIQPRKVGPDFDPRGPGGRFAPVKSIPLVGDPPAPTPVRTARSTATPTPAHSTVPIDGFGPSTPPETSPSPFTDSNGLIGSTVRFSRGNSRAHGVVQAVRGDIARVKNAEGVSVRVPVSQLTILQKATSASTSASTPTSVPATTTAAATPPYRRRPGMQPEFPQTADSDENDSMFIQRTDPQTRQPLQFPVPVNPSTLLPAHFKNARNVRYGSPLSGQIDSEGTRGMYGGNFESGVPWDTQFKNSDPAPSPSTPDTVLISKSDATEPGTYAHEINHAVYEKDLTPVQRRQFDQTAGGAMDQMVSGKIASSLPMSIRDHAWDDNRTVAVHEAFAELGAQYMLNPSAFKSKYPDWYGMFKQFYGGKEYVRARTGGGDSSDSDRPPVSSPSSTVPTYNSMEQNSGHLKQHNP